MDMCNIYGSALLPALLLLALDQPLKARAGRDVRRPRTCCGGWLRLRFFPNPGLSLNFLAPRPRLVRAIVAAVFSVFIVLSWDFVPSLPPWGRVALGLLWGGGLSNLLDRLRRGYVTDYFSFPRAWPRVLRRLVFNLADLAIFSGVLLLTAVILLT